MQRKRLSIVIPAYNEEGNLEGVIAKIDSVAPRYCTDYEMIIVNDGSSDGTKKVATRLAKNNKRVRAIHNSVNKGMGCSYLRGVRNARFEFVMIVFGDNDHPAWAMRKVISKIGKADMIIPYYTNFISSRTWLRHVVSITYTRLLNCIADLPLRYYNGITMHRTDLVRGIKNLSTGFGFQAEIIINLAKKGASYIEVGIENEERKVGASSAFRISNIIRVCRCLIRLYRSYRLG